MRGTSMADVQVDIQEVLSGPEWRVVPDAFAPAGILAQMEATAETLRPRLLAVHRSCQGDRRPPWLGAAATLVQDVEWMLNSWRGLALAYDVDWTNHEKEFSANVVQLESHRSALRDSVKETAPTSGVRVPRYRRCTSATRSRRRAAIPTIIPSSRPARGTLVAATLLMGLVGLLSVALSGAGRPGIGPITARAAAPTESAWAAPTAPHGLTLPPAPPGTTSSPPPAARPTPPATPDRTDAPPKADLLRAKDVTATHRDMPLVTALPSLPHATLPSAAPQLRAASAGQPVPAVTGLFVDQPTYGPDHDSVTLTVRVTTTGPEPVSVVLTSASSAWRGMLGWNNPSVRILHLAGQSAYELAVPFSARDYCGVASGLRYWGAMVTTNPAAPNQSVYVDLPAVC